MVSNISKKRLFNPSGSDEELDERRLVGGNTTNILDLSSTKYAWAKDLYHEMIGNFWIPEKQDLTRDKEDYENFDDSLKGIIDEIIGSLTFLDSLQTSNLPNIADYITAPEVVILLSIQTYQEAIHSQAYGNVAQTITPKEKLKNYFRIWEKYPTLAQRNDFLAGIYQKFLDEPTMINFGKVLLADYILESISFFMAFNIFYEIGFKTTKLTGTIDTIRLINRDELTHVELFRLIFLNFQEENNFLIQPDEVAEIFTTALENEKAWTKTLLETHFSQGNCFGINVEESEKYLNYLVNSRLIAIGNKPLFSKEETDTKLLYLEKISGLFATKVKSNFFETNPTSYNMWSVIGGWKKLEKTLEELKEEEDDDDDE